MDKTELGATILKRLGYIDEGIQKYKQGKLMYSEEPYGILFDLTTEMTAVVKKLRKRGTEVCAVISGRYRMSAGDIMPATTYLCLQ